MKYYWLIDKEEKQKVKGKGDEYWRVKQGIHEDVQARKKIWEYKIRPKSNQSQKARQVNKPFVQTKKWNIDKWST